MRLSRNTIAILRNFSKINSGLHFQKGHMQRTVNEYKSMIASVVLDEECSAEAWLYPLKEFIALIATSDNPLQLTFDTAASDTFPHGCVTIQEVGTLNRI